MANAIGMGTLLDDVDSHKVRQGTRKLDKGGRSDATVNRYLSRFRTFLAWNVAEKNRTVPVTDINWDWRKETKGRIRWLSFEEGATICSLVPQGTAQLIQVAIATGCRREELMSATLGQVEDDAFHMWKTKNGEPRSVPITPETAATLRELIGGTMPSARSLRRHWDKAKKEMGMEHDKEFVFHACRHTCATRLLDADVDTLIIKEWLGHKRIETTQRYTHVRPKNLRAAMLRVGDLRARETGQARLSAVPSLPHTNPTSGGIDHESQAA